MKKSRYDGRSLRDLLSDLLLQRTEMGDHLKLSAVQPAKNGRPSLAIDFTVRNEKLRSRHKMHEDLSDWIPTEPFRYVTDGAGNRILNSIVGYRTWDEYTVEVLKSLSKFAESMGRRVSVEHIVAPPPTVAKNPAEEEKAPKKVPKPGATVAAAAQEKEEKKDAGGSVRRRR